MLVDKLRMPIAPQKHAEIIEPSDDALQFHSIDKENRKGSFILANVIEEGIL